MTSEIEDLRSLREPDDVFGKSVHSRGDYSDTSVLRVPSSSSSSCRPLPRNPLVCALLTDLYQLTMTYAYWKSDKHNEPATFELFFRKCPFGGEYAVFAGLDECLKYLTHFSFSKTDLDFIRTSVPTLSHAEDSFWEYLAALNTNQVTVSALPEGSIAFPRVPLLVVQGPLAICQLLETTLLTLVNYPSLVCTNAARMVRAAQAKRDVSEQDDAPAQCSRLPSCVEFGLRRSQGPDGGISASHYAHLGGFSATSNVLAGKISGIPLAGTHAHAFVQSFCSLTEVENATIVPTLPNNGPLDSNTAVRLLPRVLIYQKEFSCRYDPQYAATNCGELAAFIAYACAFPSSFLSLVDTYDTLQSGVLNFILVASALDDLGYTAIGVRLDSGDLASLSMECAKLFAKHAQDRPFFKSVSIVASNDLNEEAILDMSRCCHAVTTFGIGTSLVTCEKQPALGCVYKLVELSGDARIKLSQDPAKLLIPGAKKAFRLYNDSATPSLDLLLRYDEEHPRVGEPIQCCHPLFKEERITMKPSRVEPLLRIVLNQGAIVEENVRTMQVARQSLQADLRDLSEAIARPHGPSPYNVSVSERLFTLLHHLRSLQQS